jgi:3-methyl-2-oxobutanoate hydroxymethyltransferase
MSATPSPVRRQTAPSIQGRKIAGHTVDKLVVLTAYTAPVARVLDPHVDVLLVGDSLGMVVYGMDNTLGVTLEMMAAHTAAVARASARAMVVADLPFGSYESSPEQAFASATVLLRAGAQAVKLEGGEAMRDTVAFLVQRGIPVMGHVGLTPQHMHRMGGFRAQGADEESRQMILSDALAVEAAGAFSLVLEGVYRPVVPVLVDACAIPVIGIGAGPECDGQVLVTEDMLGLSVQAPRFAKAYQQVASSIEAAALAFAEDVKSGNFPQAEHCFLSPGKKISS